MWEIPPRVVLMFKSLLCSPRPTSLPPSWLNQFTGPTTFQLSHLHCDEEDGEDFLQSGLLHSYLETWKAAHLTWKSYMESHLTALQPSLLLPHGQFLQTFLRFAPTICHHHHPLSKTHHHFIITILVGRYLQTFVNPSGILKT